MLGAGVSPAWPGQQELLRQRPVYARAAFEASKVKFSMLKICLQWFTMLTLGVRGLSMKIVCWILKTKPLVEE